MPLMAHTGDGFGSILEERPQHAAAFAMCRAAGERQEGIEKERHCGKRRRRQMARKVEHSARRDAWFHRAMKMHFVVVPLQQWIYKREGCMGLGSLWPVNRALRMRRMGGP